MKEYITAADQISLFCRMNINTKRELPVRASEMGMLIYLTKTDGDKTPMGVANFFKTSKAMATNMVTSMVKKGYLLREQSENDRRSITLRPTEKALELVNETYSEYFKTMELLKFKMGEKDFDNLILLIKKANGILLEDKHNG